MRLQVREQGDESTSRSAAWLDASARAAGADECSRGICGKAVRPRCTRRTCRPAGTDEIRIAEGRRGLRFEALPSIDACAMRWSKSGSPPIATAAALPAAEQVTKKRAARTCPPAFLSTGKTIGSELLRNDLVVRTSTPSFRPSPAS